MLHIFVPIKHNYNEYFLFRAFFAKKVTSNHFLFGDKGNVGKKVWKWARRKAQSRETGIGYAIKKGLDLERKKGEKHI